MSILNALKQNSSSIDDLAKLPQAMIMQMAQKKSISADMVAPILARKAEMMDAVARTKTMQQPDQVPPSVLEQLMAKNVGLQNPMQSQMQAPMPQSPADIGVGQLPVPERQYAGGGIVAFKRGDLVDLEDEADDEDLIAEYAAAMQAGELAMMQGEQGSPQGNAGVGIRYQDPLPRGGEAGIRDNSSIRDRLHDIVIAKESGGRRFAKDGSLLTSPKGALGERQVMPYTAKDPGFGIKAARDNSPDEIARVGKDYLNVMLDRYQDPKTAMIAYNMGPTATDKWLKAGANIKDLPKETRGYISNVNLAGGGEVRHFANEGYVDPFGAPSQDYDMDTLRIEAAQAAKKRKADAERYEFLKQNAPEMAAKMGDPDKPAPTKPTKAAPTKEKSAYIPNANPLLDDRDVGMQEGAPKAKTITPEQIKEENYYDKFMKQMGQERADLAKQKTEDRNMALLAAGLGMLGGSSSNAFTNIGQGGLSGVSYLADANKQRAAQSAALSKSELTAQRYKELGEISQGNQAGIMANRAGELAVRQGTLDEKRRDHDRLAIQEMEKNSLAKATAALRAQGLLSADNLADPQLQQKLNEWVQNDLAVNKAYNKKYQDYYGFAYDAPAPSGGNATMAQGAAAEKARREAEKNKEKK